MKSGISMKGTTLKIIKFDGQSISEYVIRLNSEDGYKVVIKGGTWQDAVPTGRYSLAGCTVAPGFDFKDFSFLSDDAQLADMIKNRFSEYTDFI